MKKSFTKSVLRQIFANKSRFIAIFAIVAIGVGFFAGILATGGDMRLGADTYYDEQHLMDFRLLSTYGFTDRDVEALHDIEGIHVYPSYFHDFLIHTGESELVCRAYSYNPENDINQPYLIDGRLPENDNECLLVSSAYTKDAIGSTVTLSMDGEEETDSVLSCREFTVVGLVLSPMYVSATQYGSTNISTGKISRVVFIPENCFLMDYYAELYVKCDALTALSGYSEKYEKRAEELSEEIEQRLNGRAVIRAVEVREEATAKLDQAKKEFNDAKARRDTEVANARKELDDASEQLKEAKNKLDSAALDIENGKSELSEKRAEYEKEIADAEEKIKAAQKAIADAEYEYRKGKEKYDAGASSYEAAAAYAKQTEQGIAMLIALYGENDPRVTEAKAQYAVLFEQLSAAKSVLDRSAKTLANAKREIEDATAEFNRARRELPLKKAEAEAQFADVEKTISEYEREYADGIHEYEEKLAEYNDAEQTFQTETARVDAEIAEAEAKLRDAEQTVSELTVPDMYVFGRKANPAYEEYGQNAERIDNIAKIFPAFFLLVAMLVSLTTMARMVEDDRTQIGTIKALGYGNASVMKKYMAYALTATISGAIPGVIIGFILLPKVIMSAYGILYVIPYSPTPFVWQIAVPSILAAVICIAVTVWLTVKSYAGEMPARLMRPGAPPKGKKIWLERIPLVWNHLGFTGKVSARNIFRYKKRMLMTTIGIAGCTALILTGFGLKDSISNIVEIQYNEIWNYDAIVALDDTENADSIGKIKETFAAFDGESGTASVMQKTLSAAKHDGSEIEVNLLVPQNMEELSHMIAFRSRRGHMAQALDSDGVIITEKLASLLGLSVGDSISLKFSDTQILEAPVSAITENYVYHYVYMTAEAYQNLTGETAAYNGLLLRYETVDEDALISAVLENDHILSLTRSSMIKETFANTMRIMDSVILVLIISAGALAFVVLYNLTNINISERIREIATLKVLGFHDREVSLYIFRENIVLTLIGTIVGLAFGRLLTAFVVQTAEIDIVMFGRGVSAWSYLFAFFLTIVFSIAATLAMKPKLDRVNMTESLKSVE